MAYTSEEVHDALREGLHDSPLYNGQIQSIGPRYCPSIETKIVTFSEKTSHLLFLEPEGVNTHEYYLNGFSSSLPLQTQLKALQRVPAFKNVHIFRPGYAIEYDFFDPTQLLPTLETKRVKNLFFAGQINGTTGYEEAAAQGLLAGINAHVNCHGGTPFTLRRDEAYIGVLIDDLITKGVDEPYRMFTSSGIPHPSSSRQRGRTADQEVARMGPRHDRASATLGRKGEKDHRDHRLCFRILR
jgi:tRNA uridine 5-carboxymethylaminomethyl modification enzyme